MSGGPARRVLILGLGNAILTDDAVGIHAVRLLEDDPRAEKFDLSEAEVAGFALLDLLADYDAAVVIDAVRVAGLEPGEVTVLDAADMVPSLHLVAAHQIDLPGALALGAEMGVHMPSTVRVVGVQVIDDRTFGERCTPAVEAAVPRAAQTALELAESLL